MNPFAAIPGISGGAGGLSSSIKDDVKQSVGGARGLSTGAKFTGITYGAPPSSSANAMIYAGAALLAVLLLRGKL